MGYYYVPSVGEKDGEICEKGSCKHVDCNKWHSDLENGCKICNGPLQPGSRIYFTGPGLVHALCQEKKYASRFTQV